MKKNMRRCPDCRGEISNSASICPLCGCDIISRDRSRANRIWEEKLKKQKQEQEQEEKEATELGLTIEEYRQQKQLESKKESAKKWRGIKAFSISIILMILIPSLIRPENGNEGNTVLITGCVLAFFSWFYINQFWQKK